MPKTDPPVSFTLEAAEPRVVMARIFALRTRADADEYSKALGTQVARLRATAPVLIADHRPVVIYPPEVTARLVELFRAMNARLERVAILAARSNAVLTLQLERLVREASFQNRRVCYTSEEAEAHLAPVLTPEELKRAREFLKAAPR